MNPADGTEMSVVDDLDPEPPQAAQLRMREVIVGVLLLVGVLAWAGYTSWRNATDSDNYASAMAALEHRQWDQALAYFSSAKGYKDSDARTANASRQIRQRDEQYAILQ